MTTDEIPVVLARIETKLDQVLTVAGDHEQRIRRLERAIWIAAGAASSVGGIAGTVASQLLRG